MCVCDVPVNAAVMWLVQLPSWFRGREERGLGTVLFGWWEYVSFYPLCSQVTTHTTIYCIRGELILVEEAYRRRAFQLTHACMYNFSSTHHSGSVTNVVNPQLDVLYPSRKHCVFLYQR